MDSYGFNILHEKVADIDLFEDKTHEKVAGNLNKVIQSEQSAVTIGLEGGWGSGKSTIVNLLRQKLSEGEQKTLIYLFDAWAHDGDPLRRIFLEGLIDEIVTQDMDQDLTQKLKSIRADISGKKKTVDVKTKKSTSKLGGFLSLSAILVPLGAALISAIDYNSVHWFSRTLDVYFPFWFGLFFTLTPLWTLVGWRLFSKDDPEKEEKGIFLGRKKWDVFESDSEERYTQDITEDGERSSIEFEQYFKRIMSLAVGTQKTYQRALIVIDNLDRVEPEQTLSIWSILQTFFQHRSRADTPTQDWQDHLWFLIPYDRDGLSNVWQTSYQHSIPSDIGLAQATESLPSVEKNSDDHTIISFFEKCFQLIEEAPEPILTAWVEYCESCIKTALTGWPIEASGVVFDTYRRYESSLTKSPTPRQIRAFVNKTGMLGMRWGSTVSPEAIALYALVRRNRSERQLRAELLNQGLPDNYQSSDPALLKAELAGLLFGVSSRKGIQLLLEPDITKALRDGDANRISELISEHGEGFWVVWASIRNRALPNGHTEEHRIAVTGAFCKAMMKHTNRVQLDIAHLVNEWRSTANKWELQKHNYVEAISALVSILSSCKSEDNFANWLSQEVKSKLKLCISNIGKNDNWSDSLEEIRGLMDYLQSIDLPIAKFRDSSLSQQNWLTWLEDIENQEIEFPEVLPSQTTISAMIEMIDPVSAGGAIADKLVTSLSIDNQSSYYAKLANKLQAWIVNPNRALNLNSPYELLIRCYRNGGKDIRASIKVAVGNTHFVQRSSGESLESTPSLLALLAIVYGAGLLESNISSNIKGFYQARPSNDMLNNVVEVLEKNRALSAIWQLARSSSNLFAIHAIRDLNDIDLFSVDTGAYFIDDYDWAEEKDIEIIVNKLIDSGAFESAKDAYIKNSLAYSECLRILLSHGGGYGQQFVNDLLPLVLADTWIESFETENNLFELLNEKGNHEFKDGVLRFAQQDLTKDEVTDFFWHNLSSIYEKLPDRNSVILAIAKNYFSMDSDPFDENAFNQISNCLSESLLSKIGTGRIMAKVELWISADQWRRLSWLIDYNFPVAKTPSESLSSRLTAALATDDGGIRETVKKLASIYSIDITKPELENAAE